MKKLILFLLLLPIFAQAQLPQNDRWTLLYEDKTANEKTFIDTQTITDVDYFEGHEKVYLIWIRTYHDFSMGKYTQQDDQHIAIDLKTSQYEINSFVKYKDGNVTDKEQFIRFNWLDIAPESSAELILNYCKKLNK